MRKTKTPFGRQGQDPSGWMVTFGDLLMLLLTFFVLLLSMKTLTGSNSESVFRYFIFGKGDQPATGGWEETRTDQGDSRITVTEATVLRRLVGEETRNLKKTATVDQDARGVVLTIDAEHLFNSGEDQIRPPGRVLLDEMGGILAGVTNSVWILGHTDDRPFRSGRTMDNWTLSSRRALAVFTYLTQNGQLEGNRIGTGGFGPVLPLVPNTTEKGRAQNRRVEFIFRPSDSPEA